MRTQFGNPTATAIEIGGHIGPTPADADKIVRPIFGPIAKIIWPANTDAHIAAIADCDPRTARRYLSGELEAPSIVYVVMWHEVIKRRLPR